MTLFYLIFCNFLKESKVDELFLWFCECFASCGQTGFTGLSGDRMAQWFSFRKPNEFFFNSITENRVLLFLACVNQKILIMLSAQLPEKNFARQMSRKILFDKQAKRVNQKMIALFALLLFSLVQHSCLKFYRKFVELRLLYIFLDNAVFIMLINWTFRLSLLILLLSLFEYYFSNNKESIFWFFSSLFSSFLESQVVILD